MFCQGKPFITGKIKHMTYPILEFDPSPIAVIEPGKILNPKDVPLHAIPCFFQDVISLLISKYNAKIIHTFRSEIGDNHLYELEYEGQKISVFHPGVGAPLAAGFLEESIAIGCQKFIACGGAGVLDNSIAVGHLIVPESAVRDEGTSYHYLPPGREVNADPNALEALTKTLDSHQVPYIRTKTWTTDGFYRETPAKILRRREEGCLAVEMEAAAFFAVALFRGVPFGQILYGGDDVSSPEWDHRGWQTRASIRERVFWLAAEACLKL
jgi:uridine phosphorylase